MHAQEPPVHVSIPLHVGNVYGAQVLPAVDVVLLYKKASATAKLLQHLAHISPGWALLLQRSQNTSISQGECQASTFHDPSAQSNSNWPGTWRVRPLYSVCVLACVHGVLQRLLGSSDFCCCSNRLTATLWHSNSCSLMNLG